MLCEAFLPPPLFEMIGDKNLLFWELFIGRSRLLLPPGLSVWLATSKAEAIEDQGRLALWALPPPPPLSGYLLREAGTVCNTLLFSFGTRFTSILDSSQLPLSTCRRDRKLGPKQRVSIPKAKFSHIFFRNNLCSLLIQSCTAEHKCQWSIRKSGSFYKGGSLASWGLEFTILCTRRCRFGCKNDASLCNTCNI